MSGRPAQLLVRTLGDLHIADPRCLGIAAVHRHAAAPSRPAMMGEPASPRQHRRPPQPLAPMLTSRNFADTLLQWLDVIHWTSQAAYVVACVAFDSGLIEPWDDLRWDADHDRKVL